MLECLGGIAGRDEQRSDAKVLLGGERIGGGGVLVAVRERAVAPGLPLFGVELAKRPQDLGNAGLHLVRLGQGDDGFHLVVGITAVG